MSESYEPQPNKVTNFIHHSPYKNNGNEVELKKN